ncbi:MAG: ABC-2 transporter permease [bacterium]|nr:ABC-2 transporter permease [bacterium]
MLSLVLKDLHAARWWLALVLPLLAVQLLGVARVPPLFLAVSLLISGLLAFGAIVIEEYQGTEVLWCSLPVTRADIVWARYASTLLGAALGLGTSWAVGVATLRRLSSERPAAPLNVEPAAYAAALALILFVAALYLPCYFRWGAGRGLMAFSVVLLGFVVSLALGGWLAELLGGSREEIVAYLAAAGRRAGYLAGAASLAIFAVSAAVASRFYSMRDC